MFEEPEANFMKLVQGLIEDTDGREHFLKVELTQTYFSSVMTMTLPYNMLLFHFPYRIMVVNAECGLVFL